MFPFFQFGELIIRHNTLVSAYICMENGFDELVCNEFVDHFSPLLKNNFYLHWQALDDARGQRNAI